MLVVHVVEPFATGINTFIHELVSGMPDDEHVIIHGERDDNRELQSIMSEYDSHVKFLRWQHAQRELNPIKDFLSYLSLKKMLNEIKFDILHLHSSKAGAIGGFWSYLNKKKNVVYTPNAVSFLRTDVSKSKLKLFKLIEKRISRSGATVVSCSESEMEAYTKEKIKTHLIENGVTIESPKLSTTDSNKNNFNIVINGKITIQKNPESINSIAQHFENDPNVKFIWIGDGELKPTLRSKNIEITGWLNKTDVFDVLQRADVYLSSALWEGLPLSVIEAMSFGLPLVLSNCPGNKDLVKNGVNGYIFDSEKDAIQSIELLQNDHVLLEHLARNSKKHYEQFDNYRCAKEYRDLYQKLTSKS